MCKESSAPPQQRNDSHDIASDNNDFDMFPTRFENSSFVPAEAPSSSFTSSIFDEEAIPFPEFNEIYEGATTTTTTTAQQEPQEQSSLASASIQINDTTGSLIFQNPPTPAERQFMSIVKLLSFHMNGLPTRQEKVAAMTSLVDYFRVALGCTFVSVADNAAISDKVRIAQAILDWISPQKELTRPCVDEIEHLLLRNGNSLGASRTFSSDSVDDFAVPYGLAPPIRPVYQASVSMPSLTDAKRPFYQTSDSFKRRRIEQQDEETAIRLDAQPAAVVASMPTTVTTVMMQVDDPAGHYPENKDLEDELERVQNEVGHIPANDVHRGKGQGVKNINGRFYTPLIASRALEYAAVNGSTKAQTDDAKHGIALEILVELARIGGRIRDTDNQTPLNNQQALKKIMVALKDKAREMKRKGAPPAKPPARVPTGEIICLARRTRENVELLKMIRARNGRV